MTMASSGTAVVELPSDTQIKVTREFDAPRHLVYEAWTTPELVERWWHANRGTVESVEIEGLELRGRIIDGRVELAGFESSGEPGEAAGLELLPWPREVVLRQAHRVLLAQPSPLGSVQLDPRGGGGCRRR